MNDDLDRAIRDLPREVAPSRDLWPGIARRIGAAPPRARGRELLAWAAGLAAVVALTGALALLVGPTRVARAPGTARPSPGVEAGRAAPSIVDAIAASTDPIRRRLLADAAADPARAALVQAHVAGLQASIGPLEQLARRHPDAPDVVLALARARRQELILLLRAAAR